MKKIIILLVLLISSCGYQPIYSNKNPSKFIFSEIELIGNKEINRKIISTLSIEKDTKVKTSNKLFLNSNLNIEETSKNSLGEVTSYRTTLSVELIIKDQYGTQKNKVFNKNFLYNNKENRFDLVEHQDQIKSNLVDEIIEELLIYINL